MDSRLAASPNILFLTIHVCLFLFFHSFVRFSVQAPVPPEGGVKAEVFSDIWPLLPLIASGLSGSLFSFY